MKITKKNNESLYYNVRVAVLGASGFIGRWVARALCSERANVYLIVRDETEAKKIFSQYNIHGEIIEMDLRDLNSIKTIFKRIRPTITFNLAGYGIKRSERNELDAYEINSFLVEKICMSIKDIVNPEWLGQDIVHVGSALEYGNIRGDLSENSIPAPTSLYGKSKLAGTIKLTNFCQKYGIKSLTARLFTVYGPGEHSERLLPSILKIHDSGGALKLTGGLQQRDFTYVEEVGKVLLSLGLSSAPFGDIVNVATGKLTSVKDFVETAAHILKISRDRLLFGALPTRPEEMHHSEVSISKLKKLILWVPSISIQKGIQNTIDFNRQITQLTRGN